MDKSTLTAFIKKEAIALGFDACGIANASMASNECRLYYESWLNKGYQAEMSYMERNFEKRMDPSELVTGAKSVIVVALNYFHKVADEMVSPKIAKYAVNPDYHKVIKDKLYELAEIIKLQGIALNGRSFTDSAPVAERYWASMAGIGWIGKNSHLIITGKGSYFLLGELIVDVELDYDSPQNEKCGSCTKCLEICPGSALSTENGLNSSRCISYLTIEKKGSFNSDEAKLCYENDYIFGCDICQDVCPWNKFSTEQTKSFMQPVKSVLNINTEELKYFDDSGFKNSFKDTCLFRTGLDALKRNSGKDKNEKPVTF